MNIQYQIGRSALGHEHHRSDLLVKSEQLAREVHAGQLYGGVDYTEAHLLPVANLVSAMGYGELYQAVALLHDAPEDNQQLTPDYMIYWGIPREVVEAVFILDKTKYHTHIAYLLAVSANPLASVGKVGDSLFNLTNILRGDHQFNRTKAQSKINEYCGNLSYLLPCLPASDVI